MIIIWGATKFWPYLDNVLESKVGMFVIINTVHFEKKKKIIENGDVNSTWKKKTNNKQVYSSKNT